MNKPSHRIVGLIAFATLSAAATSTVAHAQDAATPPDATVVHPDDDGYPDMKAAYDILAGSGVGKTMLDNALSGDPDKSTLTEKRVVLRDPAAQHALAMLHTALTMPDLTVPKILPLMWFDILIRLLATHQYVQFADGQSLAAVDTLAESFRLADVLRDLDRLGAAYSGTIKLKLIESTGAHLDQFSARDSAYLLSVMRRAAQPDPFLQECESERRFLGSIGDRYLDDVLKYDGGDSEYMPFHLTPAIRKEAADALAANPVLIAALNRSIHERVGAYFDDLEARYQAFPTVAPDTLGIMAGKTVTGSAAADQVASFLVAHFAQDPGTEQFIVEKQMRIRAYERLIAVHAAIKAYLWEHNRVPDTLADLNLGILAQDPFSTEPFRYTHTGDRSYTLVSVGSARRAMDGNGNFVADGKPVPISLVP